MTDWRYTIVIKRYLTHTSKCTSEELADVRDNIVRAVKRARDYKAQNEEGYQLEEVVDELSAATDVRLLDEALAMLYDWADQNLVWIE